MLEIIILFIISLITLMIILILAKKWGHFSNFFHSHYTLFNIIFVILYFLEQAFFLIASSLEYNRAITTGLFALIVLTTATLQGIMLEIRNKKISSILEKSNQDFTEKRFEMKEKYNSSLNKLREYIGFLEEEFYNNKRKKTKN